MNPIRIFSLIVTFFCTPFIYAQEIDRAEATDCSGHSKVEVWCQNQSSSNQTKPTSYSLTPLCQEYISYAESLFNTYISVGTNLKKLSSSKVSAEKRKFNAAISETKNDLSRLSPDQQDKACAQMIKDSQ